jgi:hypothetical protein
VSHGKHVRAPLSQQQRDEADRIIGSFVRLRDYLKRVSECLSHAQRGLRETRARRPRDPALVAAYERELSVCRGLSDEGLAAVYGPAKTLDRRLNQALVVRHLDEAVACVERLLSRPERGTAAAALRRDDRQRLASHVRAVLLLDGEEPGLQVGIATDVRDALKDPHLVDGWGRSRTVLAVAIEIVAHLSGRAPRALTRLISKHRRKTHRDS